MKESKKDPLSTEGLGNRVLGRLGSLVVGMPDLWSLVEVPRSFRQGEQRDTGPPSPTGLSPGPYVSQPLNREPSQLAI